MGRLVSARVHGHVQRVVAVHAAAAVQLAELVRPRMVLLRHGVRVRRVPAVRRAGGPVQRIVAVAQLAAVAGEHVCEANAEYYSAQEPLPGRTTLQRLFGSHGRSKRSGRRTVRYSVDVLTGGSGRWRIRSFGQCSAGHGSTVAAEAAAAVAAAVAAQRLLDIAMNFRGAGD